MSREPNYCLGKLLKIVLIMIILSYLLRNYSINLNTIKLNLGEKKFQRIFKNLLIPIAYSGSIRDSEGKSIEVLAVKLLKNNPEFARTMQRNFIAKHLAQRMLMLL